MIGIGDDQSLVARQQMAGEILADGKIEKVAMGPVFRPLAIAQEVGRRRLDLDDDEAPALVEAGDIGAAAIRQLEFADRAKPHVDEKPPDAAGQAAGGSVGAGRFALVP